MHLRAARRCSTLVPAEPRVDPGAADSGVSSLVEAEVFPAYVQRLVDAGSWYGIRRILVTGRDARDRLDQVAHAANAIRASGMLTITSAAAARRTGAPDITSRHLAMLIATDADRRAAPALIDHLIRASPRGHLLVDLTRADAEPQAATAETRVRRLAEDAEDWIDAGRLDRAEALLAGARVICDLAAAPVPAPVAVAWSRLRFWTAGFDASQRIYDAGTAGRARCPTGEVPATRWLEAALLQALTAWWQQARSRLRECRAIVDSTTGREPELALARGLLTWMSSLLDGAPPPAVAVIGRLQQAWLRAPESHTTLLIRLIGAEVCATIGQGARARQWLHGDAWRRGPWLYRACRDWLAAGLVFDDEQRVGCGREISARGVLGIRRFGEGTFAMPWLHALPELLQRVNDAEDESVVLTGGCQWLMAHCGAHAAAFLEGEGGSIVGGGAGARAAFSDLERERAVETHAASVTSRPDGVVIAVPIRYLGNRIGALIVAGPSERATGLSEATASLAALCAPALRARLDALFLRRHVHERLPELLGVSPAMTTLREAIVRAAASAFPVLVEGESGSGKELVAQAIHRLSARRDRRFAALNCAALSDDLAESELFGHTRGAFTGAVGPRAGLFEEAHAGTLFLDEVAELSARAQAKLLRVLQEHEVRRIGENTARVVDVRVVAATNRSLRAMVQAGEFREDLLFRLAVLRIRVPPLRDRPEDIPLLTRAFWTSTLAQTDKRAVLAPDALACLARHTWPGNVRELQNAVAALVALAPSRGRVSARHVHLVLEEATAADLPPASLDRARLACERRTIAAALARHAGRRAAAARELGLTRQGLAKAIKRLKADSDDAMAGVA